MTHNRPLLTQSHIKTILHNYNSKIQFKQATKPKSVKVKLNDLHFCQLKIYSSIHSLTLEDINGDLKGN